MTGSATIRARLENLIDAGPPDVKEHVDRLTPGGSSLAERSFAYMIAHTHVFLDAFRGLVKVAPLGSDDRERLVTIASLLKSHRDLYRESFDLAAAMRTSALRRRSAACRSRGGTRSVGRDRSLQDRRAGGRRPQTITVRSITSAGFPSPGP